MVVWDLDDTLWRGTLNECPVELNTGAITVVRALNRRGIVNSICSKNDRSEARRRLQKDALWDEFVFASIDLDSEGSTARPTDQ